MENFELVRPEGQKNDGIQSFIELLSKISGEYSLVKHEDATYEIEAENFSLTFTVKNNVFEIRSIDVRGNSGLGHQVIESIHEYADSYYLDVIASNVLDVARGFWDKMGYQEGATAGEYFRVG